MTRDAWNRLTDAEKLDYLYQHSEATEDAIRRLSAGLQLLHERLKKLEAAAAENVA